MMRWLPLLALLLVACEPADNGWLAPGGEELRPVYLPGPIVGDESLEPDGLEYLPEFAMDWWNTAVGEVIWDRSPDTGSGPPLAVLTMNYVTDAGEWDENTEAETTYLEWDEHRRISSCVVTLNVDLGYHPETMELAALHGVGHCLALADDDSLDLRSIMNKPLDPLGELTDHDRQLLRGWLRSE